MAQLALLICIHWAGSDGDCYPMLEQSGPGVFNQEHPHVHTLITHPQLSLSDN